jgi:hypothetical protein
MDVQVLRFWGIVVGSALIAIALWIAALGPETAPARATTSESVQTAQTQPAASPSFLVRFRGSGPIARAQADAARGGMSQAQRRIEAQLRRQRAFAGLCFERFTAGAAEIVLATCTPVAFAGLCFERFTAGAAEIVLATCTPVATRERAAVEARWLSRLRGMRGVAYADVNATAAVERAPG